MSDKEFKERPYLLSCPNIPKPLHGLNPRTIMGKLLWDETRKQVYASTGFKCAACGVHKCDAKKHKWLEAHEIFEINYANGTATLNEIVPLCHFCHSFIHSGLLRMRARKKEVSVDHVRDVLFHGCEVLRRDGSSMFSGTAKLCDLVSISRDGINVMKTPANIADWGKWKMIWGGKEYKGKFKSMRDWRSRYC